MQPAEKPSRDALFQKISKARGFDSVDTMLKSEKARPVKLKGYAGGGLIDGVKNMLGMKTETVTEKFARQDAEFRAKHPQPAAPASAPAQGNTAIGDYAGMTALQKREKAAGLKAGGMVKKKCVEGGEIEGPGGPTDDLVPIMASNGEFMIKASSAKILGQELLEALNDVGGKEEPKKGDKLKTGGMVRKMYKGGPVALQNDAGYIDTESRFVNDPAKLGVKSQPKLSWTNSPAIPTQPSFPNQYIDVESRFVNNSAQIGARKPPLLGKTTLPAIPVQPSFPNQYIDVESRLIDDPKQVGNNPAKLASKPVSNIQGQPTGSLNAPQAPKVQAATPRATAGATMQGTATPANAPQAQQPTAPNSYRQTAGNGLPIDGGKAPSSSGLAGSAAALSGLAMGSSADSIRRPTEDYRRRFGMDVKDGSLAGDIAARAGGVMTDLGASILDAPVGMLNLGLRMAGGDGNVSLPGGSFSQIVQRNDNPEAVKAYQLAQAGQPATQASVPTVQAPAVDDSAIAATEAQKRASGQQGVAYNLNDPASNASILAQNPAGAVRKVGNSYSGSNVTGNVGFVGANGNPISGRPGGGYLTGGAPTQATQSLQNPDGSQWSEGDNAIMAENIRDGIDPTRGTSRGQHGGASIIGGPAIPGGDPNDLLSANHEAMRRANIAATRSGYRPEDKAMRAAGVSLVSGLGQQFGQAKQDQQANARTAMTTQATQAQTDATSRNQANANQIAQGQLGLNRQKQTQDNALARDKQATDTGMEKIKQQLWAAYTTGTPEQKAQAAEQLAMLSGKTQKADEYATDVVTDDKGVQRVVATNKRTGQQNGQQSAQAPHPDGTKLLGKDGKSYIVKNGVPVLN